MATSNAPAFKIRDGLVTLTCWENTSSDSDKPFHSIEVVKSYQDKDKNWQETNSFTGSDILKVSSLTQEAYTKIRQLRYEE